MTPEEACNFPLDLENHYGYIYCITFPNNKRYIGQCTRPWKNRWAGHKCGHCIALRSALYKYPIEQVTWEILEYAADRAALDSLEQFYIQKFGSLVPHGYNLTTGGQKNIPISILVTKPVLTKEEKKELKRTRLLMEQLKNFEDTGFNIISYLTAQNGHQCISGGQLKSALASMAIYNDSVKAKEMKEKLSQIQQNLRSHPVYCVELNETFSSPTDAVKKHPEWNKTKINACCIGTSSTHRGLHFYHPDDSSEKLETLKIKWKTVGVNTHKSSGNGQRDRKNLPVKCITTGVTYSTAKEASEKLNIPLSQIFFLASLPKRSYKGLHFTYAAQETL